MTKRLVPFVGYFVASIFAGLYLGYVASRGMNTRFAMLMPGILLTLLAFAWCRRDALQHDRRFALWARLLVVLVAPFGFLVYVFTSRPCSGAIRTSLIGFGVAALGSVLFIGSLALTALFGV